MYRHRSANISLIDLVEVQRETKYDKELKQVLQWVENGFPNRLNKELKPYWLRKVEIQQANECFFWGVRLIIPRSLKPRVLAMLHSQHVGATRMKMLAKKEIWYPGIEADIEQYVASCEVCAKFERKNKVNLDVSAWPEASAPLERVHIDFYNKFGKDFIIWFDAYSRYMDVKQMESKDAKYTLEYLKGQIALFGFPQYLVSDNNPPFHATELEEYLNRKKIKHLFSPP